ISRSSTGGNVLRHARLLASFAFLLALTSFARADSLSPADHLFREGWALLSEEKFPEERETFGALSPGEYDLGDYVLFFTGFALAREGKLADAAAVHDRLVAPFPRSPPVPYLHHRPAFAAVKGDDLPGARKHFEASRGKVTGNGRKAVEGYLAARLMEEGGNAQEGDAGRKNAAEAYLENFFSYTVQDGAVLSMDRLWQGRGGGGGAPRRDASPRGPGGLPPDRSGRRSISFSRGWRGGRAGPRRPAGSSSRSRRAGGVRRPARAPGTR